MSRRLARYAAPLILLGVLVAGWEIWVRLAHVDPIVFPPPSAVARALAANTHALADNGTTTLAETALGFLGGAIFGLLVAALISGWPIARRAAEPLLVGLQTVPPVVLAPILVLALGFGWGPRIVVVIGVVFFPVAIAAAGAFTSADPARLELARSFGATRTQILRTVIIPGAVPAIFDGLRISAAYALGSAAIAEQIGGARSGLGLFIARSQRNSRPDQVLAAVAVIAALSLAIYGAVGLVARRLSPWNIASPAKARP